MGSLIAVLLPMLGQLLQKVIPDANARAQAQEELTKALLAQQTELLNAAKDVMAADSASENKLTSSARPIVVYWSLSIITIIVILAPFGKANIIVDALKEVPSDLWTLITAGVGIFMFGRGAEQTVKALKK